MSKDSPKCAGVHIMHVYCVISQKVWSVERKGPLKAFIPHAHHEMSLRRLPVCWILSQFYVKHSVKLNPNCNEKMATTFYLCQSIFNGLKANSWSPFCVGYKLPSEGCITGRQSLESYVIGKHIGQCTPANLVLAAGMVSLQSASLIKSSLTIRLSRSYGFSHNECSVSELYLCGSAFGCKMRKHKMITLSLQVA